MASSPGTSIFARSPSPERKPGCCRADSHASRCVVARLSSTRLKAADRRIPGSLADTLLARYAEAIFWLARYVERAENLARILDVNETFSRDRAGGQDWLPILQLNADQDRFFADH